MLGKVFNGNNIFFRTMGKLGDFMCLNLLYLITCLPIVTIGASTCALYDVLYQIGEGTEGNCLGRFWDSWRTHFKRATLYWCICLLLGVVLGAGVLGVGLMNGSMQILFRGVAVIGGILWLGIAFFGLILIAWTELSVRLSLYDALLITVGSLPWLALNMLVTCLPAIVILTMHIRIVAWALPMFLLFGIVLLDYMKMFAYKQALKKYGLLAKENEDGIR